MDHKKFIELAVKIAIEKQDLNNGGPFGCVIVKDGKIIAEGWNHVTSENDPTAHGEIVAIRKAGKVLNNFDLTGCVLYTSSEPCPMCLSAIYWANIVEVYYSTSIDDATEVGFRDTYLYQQLAKSVESRDITMKQIERSYGLKAFEKWKNKADKKMY